MQLTIIAQLMESEGVVEIIGQAKDDYQKILVEVVGDNILVCDDEVALDDAVMARFAIRRLMRAV